MNTELNISTYLYNKAAAKRLPIGGTFELTPVCNMACKMCYVRMTPSQVAEAGGLLDADTWISLGEQAKSNGTLYLLVTGGEPFTHPEFRKIYTALAKMGFVISINTNGTLIDGKVIEWIKEIPPVRFNITLYGSSRETYERLCGDGRNYDKAVNAIEALRANGMNVRINASFTKLNIGDADGIYEFAHSRNLPISVASYMFPPARRLMKPGEEFPRLDAEAAGRSIFRKELSSNTPERVSARANAVKKSLENGEVFECEEGCEGNAMKCRAGRASFWISYNGDMSTCGMMPLPRISAIGNGFAESWKYIVGETEKIRLAPGCKTCRYRNMCTVCAAMAYCETGDFGKIPEYTCKMTETVVKEYIHYADNESAGALNEG